MISIRYRTWDWDAWTYVTLDGPEELLGLSTLGGMLLRQEIETEVFDEDDWFPFEGEEQ